MTPIIPIAALTGAGLVSTKFSFIKFHNRRWIARASSYFPSLHAWTIWSQKRRFVRYHGNQSRPPSDMIGMVWSSLPDRMEKPSGTRWASSAICEMSPQASLMPMIFGSDASLATVAGKQID